MKAFFTNKITVIVMAIVLALGAGFGTWAIIRANQPNEDDTLTIYTSFYPLYDFTQKIGGNKVEVVNLISPGGEVHDYEPTTQQMVGMYDADLVIINGAGMEEWIEELDTSLTDKLVDTSIGVTLLTKTTEEEHEHTEDEEEHDHGIYDPHIWLSIVNAKQQMLNIANALSTLDPDNASYYQNNYQANLVLLNGLQSQFDDALSAHNGESFVVSHAAFGYMSHEYNLNQLSLSGMESDEEPDAQTLATMIDYINTNNVSVVFYQSALNSKVAESIANQTNASVGVLNTISSLSQDQIDAGFDYYALMAQNLVSLQNAFNAE